jgi:hypothetical protein
MLVDWAHKFRTPGEWANLQESIQKQLKSFQPSEESAEYTFEFDTHYYFLVFATYDSDPAGEVVRIPVHKPALLQYSQRFPGIKSVVEVFVSVNPLATLSSSYLVTPKPNPIVASLPGFVKQFDVGKLLVVAAREKEKAHPEARIAVHITKVTFPDTRASIAIADRIESPGYVDGDKLSSAVKKLQQRMPVAVPNPKDKDVCVACYQAILAETAKRLKDVVSSQNENKDLKDWSKKENKELTKVKRDDIEKVLDDRWHRLDDALTNAYDGAFAVGGCASLVDRTNPNLAVIGDLETRLHALTTKPELVVVKGTSAYDNLPLTTWDLGLVAAAILTSGGSDTRVQVSGNVLSPNPLSGTLTMGVVNWHPIPFDSSQFNMERGEVLRIFGGLIITPDIGVGAGVGCALYRGLSLNVGAAWIRVDKLRAGDQIGQPPKDPNHPLATGKRTVTFAGFGYTF